MCTVGFPERTRHASGTVGDRGARPGRTPAAARAHKPAHGPYQPWDPTRVPARACAVREDQRARDRTAGGGASGRASEPTSAGGRAPAAGADQGDATGTCARL